MNAFLSLLVILSLIAGLRGDTAMSKEDGVRELDRDSMLLGRDLFSFDQVVKKADFIGIVRLVDRGAGRHATPPFPVVSYDEAKVEVLHMLLGEAAGSLRASYGVVGVDKQSLEHPPLGTVMIVVALKGEGRIQMIRYLFPTPKNLELLGRLIREYHARELKGNPSAALRLEETLKVPLDAYQPKPPPSAPPPAIAVVPPPTQAWPLWLWGGLVVALIAAGWLKWRSSSD